MQEAGYQVPANLHLSIPGNTTQESVPVVNDIEDGEDVADEQRHDERLDQLVRVQHYRVENVRHRFVQIHDQKKMQCSENRTLVAEQREHDVQNQLEHLLEADEALEQVDIEFLP